MKIFWIILTDFQYTRKFLDKTFLPPYILSQEFPLDKPIHQKMRSEISNRLVYGFVDWKVHYKKFWCVTNPKIVSRRHTAVQGGPGQSQEICPDRANYCTFAPFATLLKAVLKRSKLPWAWLSRIFELGPQFPAVWSTKQLQKSDPQNPYVISDKIQHFFTFGSCTLSAVFYTVFGAVQIAAVYLLGLAGPSLYSEWFSRQSFHGVFGFWKLQSLRAPVNYQHHNRALLPCPFAMCQWSRAYVEHHQHDASPTIY